MTTDLFTQYAQLDPAKADDAQPDWGSVGPVLLTAIDEGKTMSQTTQTRDNRQQTTGTKVRGRWNGAWVAVAAFAVIVIAAFAAIQLVANDTPPADDVPAPPFENALVAADAYITAVAAGDVEAVHAMYGEGYNGYLLSGETIAETTERFEFAAELERTYEVLECSESSPTSATCVIHKLDHLEQTLFGAGANWNLTVRTDDSGYLSSTSFQLTVSEPPPRECAGDFSVFVESKGTRVIEIDPAWDSKNQLPMGGTEAGKQMVALLDEFSAQADC